MITAQIKKLVDDGYDYEQQLRAFKWYFDKGNQYMGYGIVAFIIEDALNDDIVEKVSVDNAKLLREKMEQRRKERLFSEG